MRVGKFEGKLVNVSFWTVCIIPQKYTTKTKKMMLVHKIWLKLALKKFRWIMKPLM